MYGKEVNKILFYDFLIDYKHDQFYLYKRRQ